MSNYDLLHKGNNSTFASCRSKGVKGVKKLGQYFVAPETSVESSDYGTNVLTP